MIDVNTLPFVPEPYKDEILGSWLARIKLVNGSGSWRSLLERAGHGNKLQLSLFDFFEFDNRAVTLFDGLGITYEQAMSRFSTLKFWSHLRGTSHYTAPGTNTIAMPSRKMTSDEPVTSIRRIRSKKLSTDDQHWYCPVCIAQDIKEGKIPYWRRLHQLPTTFYCMEHHVALENTCYTCGASARPHQRRGWGTLPVKCDCGADMRNVELSKVNISPFFQRLAKIGADALSMESVWWSAHDVHRAALNLLKKNYGKQDRSYYRKAFEALGASIISGSTAYLKPPFAKKSLFINSIGANSVIVAPSIFAEMGIELRKAMEDYQLIKLIDNYNYTPFTPANYSKLSINEARRSFVQTMERTKSYSNVFSYWYLRLYDAEWLERYMGRRIRIFPTIAKDRDEALRCIESGALPSSASSPLMFRLCMRDKFLYDRIRRLSMRGSRGRERANTSVKELRLTVLTGALQSFLAEENEPKRITYGMLGKRVSLSTSQVSDAILAFPELKSALDEANRNKTKRQWRWAIRLEYDAAKGEALKLIRISRRAKLPLTPEARKYVYSCIAELLEIKAPKTEF